MSTPRQGLSKQFVKQSSKRLHILRDRARKKKYSGLHAIRRVTEAREKEISQELPVQDEEGNGLQIEDTQLGKKFGDKLQITANNK